MRETTYSLQSTHIYMAIHIHTEPPHPYYSYTLSANIHAYTTHTVAVLSLADMQPASALAAPCQASRPDGKRDRWNNNEVSGRTTHRSDCHWNSENEQLNGDRTSAPYFSSLSKSFAWALCDLNWNKHSSTRIHIHNITESPSVSDQILLLLFVTLKKKFVGFCFHSAQPTKKK